MKHREETTFDRLRKKGRSRSIEDLLWGDGIEKCPPHDWQVGASGWGVIYGCSRCKKCGKLAEPSDFSVPEPTPLE